MSPTTISTEPRFTVPPPAKPFAWALVTGRDFGRSIAWARRTPNPLTAHIRAHRNIQKPASSP